MSIGAESDGELAFIFPKKKKCQYSTHTHALISSLSEKECIEFSSLYPILSQLTIAIDSQFLLALSLFHTRVVFTLRFSRLSTHFCVLYLTSIYSLFIICMRTVMCVGALLYGISRLSGIRFIGIYGIKDRTLIR